MAPTTNTKPTKRKRKPSFGKLVNLTIGDWSNDGHGRTHRVSIRTNLSKPAIDTAYKKGCKLVGVDFQEEICADYEDNRLPDDLYQKLVLLGLDVDHIFGEGFEAAHKGQVYIDYDSYWLIWLFIVKLGEPSFRYIQVLEGSDIKIGGYGLFFS